MTPVPSEPDYAAMREAMVVSQLRPNAVTDPRVLAAMASVPREDFVPENRRAGAYIDRPLRFDDGRAINSPLTTARLLDAAEISANDRVLLVGGVTGYAEAVLRALAADVAVVEAGAELTAAGTFDAIVIDGAVEYVPDALVALLSPTGTLVCALVEGSVTRLCRGRKGGSGFALTAFADADAVRLPGFAKPREFVF